MKQQFQALMVNALALGGKRIGVLAFAFFALISMIVIGARFVNQPEYQTLYVNMGRDDINRIGLVLSEVGIRYDVNSAGDAISVARGETSRARMILAEKGLPAGTGSGYELFDNLGSLGLTSFMQEITKVRALEGEIARSIQAFDGVKGVRVHLVLPDTRSFSNRDKAASASVLATMDGLQPTKTALAIRHLVAAAVPQLSVEHVTVLDGDGSILASGESASNTSITSSFGVQQSLDEQLSEKVRTALNAYLGSTNFRISIRSEVDMDQRQVEETVFDPESRVERSVQVVRSQDEISQQAQSDSVSVEQNLPNAEETPAAGPKSSQASERREETTNYEINSKKTSTVKAGYDVSRLSASVLVNRAKLVELIGQSATDSQIQERVLGIENMVKAAIGFKSERSDVMQVTAVEFAATNADLASPSIRLMDTLTQSLGTYINAAAFLIASLVVVFLGIRPMLIFLAKPIEQQAVAQLGTSDEASLDLQQQVSPKQLSAPMDANADFGTTGQGNQKAEDHSEPDFEDVLNDAVTAKPDDAAKIFKRWLQDQAA